MPSMTSVFVAVSVILAATCAAVSPLVPTSTNSAADPRDAGPIVGARVKTCSGCRLNSLHDVRRFIKDELRRYPALDLTYIPGHDPIIEFVNQYNRVVLREELAPFSLREIHTMVQKHGIHTYTPKPDYIPFPFSAVGNCVAWRQTGSCDPQGPRESTRDESCLDEVEVGRSGYCECAGGDRHGFACDHVPLTCKSVCEKPTDFVTVAATEPQQQHREDL